MCYRLEQLSQQRATEQARDRETLQQRQHREERRESLPADEEAERTEEIEVP